MISFPPPKSNWASAGFAQRSTWAIKMFIRYPRMQTLLDAVNSKIEACRAEGVSDGLFIKGEPGSGKSRFVSYLVHLLRVNVQPDDRELIPILCINAGDCVTRKQFCSAMLRALTAASPWQVPKLTAKTDTYPDLMHRVVTLFRECGVIVVALDNLQDIPLKRSIKGMEDVMTGFRDLMDRCEFILILLGTDAGAEVLDSNPQLRKRVPYVHELRYFSIFDDSRMREFKALVQNLDGWLPLAETSCITQPSVTALLFFATHGILSSIIKLLSCSWPIAVRDGREALVLDDLAKGFELLFGDLAGNANPFVPGFVPRLLDKDGEPYHGWH